LLSTSVARVLNTVMNLWFP